MLKRRHFKKSEKWMILNVDFAFKLSNYTVLKRYICLKWILKNFSTINYILSSTTIHCRSLHLIIFMIMYCSKDFVRFTICHSQSQPTYYICFVGSSIMRWGRQATTISRPSHLGILVLPLFCKGFQFLKRKLFFFNLASLGHKKLMD